MERFVASIVSIPFRCGDFVHRYDLDLVSMEPPTFKGYGVHPGAGACQFTATKM
jgi:hypothetical protein